MLVTTCMFYIQAIDTKSFGTLVKFGVKAKERLVSVFAGQVAKSLNHFD